MQENSNENNNKVTVSFKCDQKLRMRLWVQSDRAGLTISSYVEMQLMTMEQLAIRVNELTDQVEEQNKQLKEKPVVLAPVPLPNPPPVQPLTSTPIEDVRVFTREIIGRFIMEISVGDKEKAKLLTNKFNQILQDERARITNRNE